VGSESLLVDVQPCNIVFNEESLFAEHLKIFKTLCVNLVIVWIQVMRKINFRLAHVVEGHFVILALFSCLLCVHYIVCMRQNFADVGLVAQETLETSKLDHFFEIINSDAK